MNAAISMAIRSFVIFMAILTVGIVCTIDSPGPFIWKIPDNFGLINERMFAVNEENCHFKKQEDLLLPENSISQIPKFNTMLRKSWYPNRTSLMHLHNMALNRAHFFSYILQRLNQSEVDFPMLPSFYYYYFSTSADVSASPGFINSSAVLMDTNYTYANWLTNLDFNKTLPLFGPKALRLDNWMDSNNWLRQPDNNTITVKDIGAGPDTDYTASWYRYNPYWTETNFFPDRIHNYKTKNAYQLLVDYATQNGSFYSSETNPYFGPTSPGEQNDIIPVRFTRPYFDCGKSNRWIVTAVAPVIDFITRYSPILRNRGPKIVGLVTMDMDFLRIDFNPCRASVGNPDYYLAGVARCKPTTLCEPLTGFGLRRGGYQCTCMAGYRLPYNQNGPYQGVDVESANNEEYAKGFMCTPVRWKQVLLQNDPSRKLNRRRRSGDGTGDKDSLTISFFKNIRKITISTFSRVRYGFNQLKGRLFGTKPTLKKESFRSRVTSKRKRKPHHSLSKRNAIEIERPEKDTGVIKSLPYLGRDSAYNAEGYAAAQKIFQQFESVNGENCHLKNSSELNMAGEVGHGSAERFEGQARTALRLAHFLSAMYQNSLNDEIYGNLRILSKLNKHQLFGEVSANVISDFLIQSSGIYFDDNIFVDYNGTRWKRFAPFAYVPLETTPTVKFGIKALDMGMGVHRNYIEKNFFKYLKERWASNPYGLETLTIKPYKRKDIEGRTLNAYDNYPLYYKAPRLEDGYWTAPYFDCQISNKNWFITYAVPFFGKQKADDLLQFFGVVTVSMKLQDLDVNQCPENFYSSNFFKNTARCDYQTTFCRRYHREGFRSGKYRCECRQGFEYQVMGNVWFYDGQLMEKQYALKQSGKDNRYDLLKCRQAAASFVGSNLKLIAFLLLLVYYKTF